MESPPRPDGLPDADASGQDRDWELLRDLVCGEDRSRIEALHERIHSLEAQLQSLRGRRTFRQWLSSPPVRRRWLPAAAVGLLLLAFPLWRDRQAIRAASILGDVPGLVVTGCQTRWLGAARLSGLRDPLGPDPVEVLRDHGMDPADYHLDFSAIPTLETEWAEERNREQARRIEALRQEFVTVVGDLDEAREASRRRDLESLTKALFLLQFPDAAGQAEILLEDGRWKIRGTVELSLYARIVERVPLLHLEGEVDTTELFDTSPASLDRLRRDIESVTLVYLPGTSELSQDGTRQAARLIRLLRQLDLLSRRLEQPESLVEVHALPIQGVPETSEPLERLRIDQARNLVAEGVPLATGRLLPGIRDESLQPGRCGVYVKLISGEASLP